ncbi:MAG: hypothetical protein LBM99_05055, partial [Bacillales bacterium]|nr:hypothetical protein [Bacillales bacterium]
MPLLIIPLLKLNYEPSYAPNVTKGNYGNSTLEVQTSATLQDIYVEHTFSNSFLINIYDNTDFEGDYIISYDASNISSSISSGTLINNETTFDYYVTNYLINEFDFFVYRENESIDESSQFTLYLDVSEEYDFYSTFSYENARTRHFNYLLEQGLIREQQFNSFVYQEYTPFLAPTLGGGPISTLVTTTIEGNIYWQDYLGKLHPAENVKVEIIGDTLLTTNYVYATIYTSNVGFYHYGPIIQQGQPVYLKISASSTNYSVVDIDNNVYFQTSTAIAAPSKTSTITRNYRFFYASDAGKGVSIHQAIQLGENCAEQISFFTFSPLLVKVASSNVGDAWYDYDTETIGIDTSRISSWDVILHEYGHYVADMLSFDDNPGGAHDDATNLIYLHGKDVGVRLAWAEGWATFYGVFCQQDIRKDLLNMPTVGDSNSTDLGNTNGLNTRCLETGSVGFMGLDNEITDEVFLEYGDGNEVNVAAILWDIFDPEPEEIEESEEYDNMEEDFYEILDILQTGNIKSLSDFLSAFKGDLFSDDYFFNDYLELGPILTKFKAGPDIYYPNNDGIGSTAPTLYWEQNGSIDNNRFTIVIRDSNLEIIEIFESLSGTNYSLTQGFWNCIRLHFDDYIYWQIIGFN